MPNQAITGFELSPQQKWIWTLGGAKGAGAASAVFWIDGSVVETDLRTAVNALVRKHEILRTVFARNTGLKFPFQVIQEDAPVLWERTSGREDASTLEATRTARQQAEKFDSTKAPTVMASLLTFSPERHALVLTVSSLAVDETSFLVLAEQLAEAYQNNSDNREALQYADFSEWQNELLQNEDDDSKHGKQFWSTRENVPQVALPFAAKVDLQVPAQKNEFELPLNSALAQIDSKNAQSFFLALWQTFLWRVTGQSEIVSEFASSCRQSEELAGAIGPIGKNLPVVSEFESDLPFAERWKQAESTLSEAQQWSDHFQPGSSGTALTTHFSYVDENREFAANGIKIRVGDPELPSDRSVLALRVEKKPCGYGFKLRYDEAFLRSEMAERFGRMLMELITAVQLEQSVPASKLSILAADERNLVVTKFNANARGYEKSTCLHYLFEEQVQRTPERPAVRYEEKAYAYAQLNARANRLAHLLRKKGIKANSAVGLCVERSAEMIVGLLGIMKAGGCYVPLVPDNPKTRLAHQLQETGASVLLTEEKLLDRLPAFSGDVLCLDRDSKLFDAESVSNPERINSADDLVYVIYTSGSTGVPKGVAIRHANLVNYTQFIQERLHLKQPQGLNFATVSTISADLGNTCIFPALISGGCVHVIGYERSMSAELFSEYVQRHGIDVLKITPSHLSTLLKASEGAKVLPGKFLIVGGEASTWEMLDTVRRSGQCSVLNHYGPTEATIGCCTFATWENDVAAWRTATLPIGRPIANDQVYILDRHLEPVPVGVAGELCISGAGLAQGYLNQPAQTSERFVPNPFATIPGQKMYRTGDLARWLPDGNIEFLGRIDHQVKIRGFRVEPAEIEAALKKHSSVQQAVITPYYDPSGEKRLAAYVVSSKTIKSDELRSFLKNELPDYMIPSAIMMLEKLPLTPNGKVDLKSLPAPGVEDESAEREFIAPRNETEAKIANIWCEVLHVERVSADHNFFELGGHSLLATQIISRIRNMFRVQLPLSSFLQTPTVGELALKVVESQPLESEEAELAKLLEQLDGLSEEDAQRLLGESASNQD